MSLTTLDALADRGSVEADVCIVGAGPAGISLALALDSAGVRSVLLESGGLEPDPVVQSLSETGTSGLTYSGTASRTRQFGGSSNCWGGWCRPLDAIDFLPRDHVPLSGWPIEYSDYLRFLPAAQSLLGLGTDDYSLGYWRKHLSPPLDKTPELVDESLRVGVWQHSPPVRFGPKFGSEIERSTNCLAVLQANATRANLVDRGVSGLVARSLGGKQVRVDAAVYVLACGGIENARLLLTLNGPDRPALGNERGLVGRYFTDHLIFHDFLDLYPLAPHLHTYVDLVPLKRLTEPAAVTPWIGISERVQERFELANTTVRLQRPESLVGSVGDDKTVWEALGKATDRANGSQVPSQRMSAVSISEIFADPDSRITLSRETDVLGVPRAHVHWQIGQADLKSLRKTAQLIGRALWRSEVARVSAVRVAQVAQLEESAYWVGCHHYGTTRMSHDPSTGVVDAVGRVHGLSNLYVTGSSTFPTPGASTPTLSIVMLALRMADHLVERLKSH